MSARSRVALLVVLLPACAQKATHHEPAAVTLAGVAPAASPEAPSPPPSASAPHRTPEVPWPLGAGPHEALSSRVAPPPGFARVAVAEGSFGAFLRDLPLEPAGTRVLSYDGGTVRGGDDPNVAAVVAMDVGSSDLQQCADSIVRLHAEWRWSRGARDHVYAAAAALPMPLSRFVEGERVVASGRRLEWQPRARRRALDHALFREYLDTVFAWANTGSLARDARSIAVAELRAGDFFVLPGGPGHAVLVLDVAAHPDGRRVALLGQGFMPAQSFHVLRPSPGSAWFAIDPASTGVKTPFWVEFPWGSLRRLDPG